MATQKTRLTRLEANAATLPPNVHFLNEQYARLTTDAERDAWYRERTDAELIAICEGVPGDGSPSAGLDWDKLTDAELQTIADGNATPEWWEQLRESKPHYFSRSVSV